MQCANATWKEALQYLLDRAGRRRHGPFQPFRANRGVAYDGKLVDQVPLNRVVQLFDQSTDLNVLKEIFARAYEAIAADSPIAGAEGAEFVCSTWGERRDARLTNPPMIGSAGYELERTSTRSWECCSMLLNLPGTLPRSIRNATGLRSGGSVLRCRDGCVGSSTSRGGPFYFLSQWSPLPASAFRLIAVWVRLCLCSLGLPELPPN